MNKILRAAAIGFMAAIAVALIPSLVRIVLGVLLIAFVARMIFRNRRRQWHRKSRMWQVQEERPFEITPIDGNWHRKTHQYNDPITQVPIY